MPRLKVEKAAEVDWQEYPYKDQAWLESRTKKGRPSWRKVTVLRKLGDKPIHSRGTGRVLTVAKLVLVQVEDEKTPRTIDLERLRGGREPDVHGQE